MKKWMRMMPVAALLLAGCETVVEQVEPLVDAQIEKEERAAGIWGTPDSYYGPNWDWSGCHEEF